MKHYFALDMPAVHFVRNTLIISVISLVPLLFLYVFLIPGFAAHLAGGGPALARFVRQVLTNGVPVVFAVNYAGFFLYAWMNARRPGGQSRVLFLLTDLPLRVILFIVLHAITYVFSADWFGSFGGSRLTALRVVAPTLARSALFENLSGVYLYATLVSALPLYVAVLQSSDAPRLSRRLPGRIGAVLTAIVLFGSFTLALTVVATLIVWLQSA